MAEWLYEAGIGENRAALVEDGTILEARIELPGTLRLGTVADARLVEIVRKGGLGRVALTDGEAMLSPLPPKLTEGQAVRVEIVREAIPERGRPKRAVAVLSDADLRAGPTLREEIGPASECRAHESDALEAAGWSELLEEAATGEIAFAGGALRMSVTPAMTLFDVDGHGPPAALALTGAKAAVAAIRRFGIGGSIGLDLPTLGSKSERQAVDAAIDAAPPGPFERTAMNGFGFVQIVRRRLRPSLPELLAADPVGAELRALLRRIERSRDRSVTVASPVAARLAREPAWREELARRTGVATEFVDAEA